MQAIKSSQPTVRIEVSKAEPLSTWTIKKDIQPKAKLVEKRAKKGNKVKSEPSNEAISTGRCSDVEMKSIDDGKRKRIKKQ